MEVSVCRWDEIETSPDGSLINFLASRPEIAVSYKYKQTEEQYLHGRREPVFGGTQAQVVAKVYHEHKPVPPAELEYKRIRNAYVFPNKGLVLLKENGCLIDYSMMALCGSVVDKRRLAGRVQGIEVDPDKIIVDDRILSSAPTISETRVYALHGGHGIYGHWWYDCMPAIFPLAEYVPAMDARILIDGLHYPAWQREAIRLLGLKNSISVHAEPVVFCEDLILPSFISISNTRSCSKVTRLMFDHLRARSDLLYGPPVQPNHKIYISRREIPWRVMKNEDALEAALAARGFNIIEPQKMTLSQQINAFRSANVVVGAAGSGTVNFGFCPTGSALIDLMVAGITDPAFFKRADTLCLDNGGFYGVHCQGGLVHDPSILEKHPNVGTSSLFSFECDVENIISLVDQAEDAARQAAK